MVGEEKFKDYTITIVGLGVVGGSFAKALKEINIGTVYGVDIDSYTINKALEEKIIDKGFNEASIPISKSDLTIICLYPKQIEEFIIKYKECFKKGSIITDVAGIKNGYIDKIMPNIREDIDFIFGHPMAGKESKGIDYSSKEVFKGANYLLITNTANKEENIKTLEDIILSIGFGKITKVSIEKHDELISYTSQLPHAIAISLINSDEWREDVKDFIGDSYRDLTRITSINEELWCQLFIGNKKNIVSQIDMFSEKLQYLKNLIIEEDEENLINMFKEGKRRREKIK